MKRPLLLALLAVFLLFQSCNGQTTRSVRNEKLSLDSLINSSITANKIPGIAVGVVKDGKAILARGYGYANVEDKIPANERTLYQLGSVSKMFTGHVLAKLIQEKHLTLEDTLAHFFPSEMAFPQSPDGQKVTLKHIATHSSEFPRYPENLERVDPDPIRGYSASALLKGIEQVSINIAIGTRYVYSNFGYGVLGTAMENKMNKDLATLMEEYIFTAYNMNQSSLVFKEDFGDQLAVPYLDVSPLLRTEPWDMGTLSGAGNVFSSVSDMNSFMIALLAQNNVNTIQQTRLFRINDTWHYGLGCFIIDSKKRNTHIVYHGGDIDGYASALTLYPEYNLGIIILTNWGEGPVIGKTITAINDEVTNHFLGEVEE